MGGLSALASLIKDFGFTQVFLGILILNQIGLLNSFKFWKKKVQDVQNQQTDDLVDRATNTTNEEDARNMRDARFENLRDNYHELKEKVEKMIAEEAKEEVRFSMIEMEQAHIKESMSDMRTEMKDNFSNTYKLLGDLKTTVIDALKR